MAPPLGSVGRVSSASILGWASIFEVSIAFCPIWFCPFISFVPFTTGVFSLPTGIILVGLGTSSPTSSSTALLILLKRLCESFSVDSFLTCFSRLSISFLVSSISFISPVSNNSIKFASKLLVILIVDFKLIISSLVLISIFFLIQSLNKLIHIL